jgi:hypothetical protein
MVIITDCYGENVTVERHLDQKQRYFFDAGRIGAQLLKEGEVCSTN